MLPHDDQRRRFVRSVERGPRLQQPDQVLARLDGAHVEHEVLRQPVFGPDARHDLRWLRLEAGGRRLRHHGDLLHRHVVGRDEVAPRRLGDGDDLVSPAAVEGQGRVEVPTVERLVVFGEMAEDQVVHGEHRRHTTQRQQQMLSGVEERRFGYQAVEG